MLLQNYSLRTTAFACKNSTTHISPKHLLIIFLAESLRDQIDMIPNRQIILTL